MQLYPLSKPQQAIWNMEQYFGGSIANVTGSAFFKEPVDNETLQAALLKTVEQCDSPRIRIKIQDGVPMQYVKAFEPCKIETARFETKGDCEKWASALARTPFDVYGDLCKIFAVEVEGKVGFMLHLHHLTADGWTLGFLMNTVIKNLKGEEIRANSYLDYITAEREYEKSARYQKDRAYFLACFEKCDEPAYLCDKQAKGTASDRLNISVSVAGTAKIQAFCTDNGITPYSLFMNALATYIYRIKGAEDMYVGTTVLNRTGKREKETAGIFVNTIPILFHIDESKSMLENMRHNSDKIMGVFRHQKYQYIDLLKDVREQCGFTGRLYDVSLNYQIAALDDSSAEVEWHFCGSQGESLNIHISDIQKAGAFNIKYDYQIELFSENDIGRLHGHLMNLIFDLMENPEKKPQELKLLSDCEYKQVVFDFNDTAVDFPKDKCIHQLFEEQAAKTPDKTAVIFEDKEYTYRHINEMSNALAHVLRDKGIGRNDIVAIIAKRSYKIIVAQLAILKASGAYLPIDPNYPADRVDFMLKDANCKIALTLGYKTEYVETIPLEKDISIEKTDNLPNINNSDDLCYVIYTSGSTGEPKGVMIAHRNFGNFNDNNNNNVQVKLAEGCKAFLCIGAFTFDMASAEVYLALLNSHTLVLASENQLSNPDEISRLIEDYSVHFILTVPTKISSCLKSDSFKKAVRKIKLLFFGGEVLTREMVNSIKNYTNTVILNAYGPTETTMGCTWTTVDGDTTIGKPIANTQIYILDKHQSPLPIGATGELCIAGMGVGKGYLNRPELTAEKFIGNPFGSGKMYKTGDLAKWREDGNIEYVGRMDNQVKIRGLRVELGEIETAISQCEGIKQIAVVVKTDESSRQYICAYYIGKNIDATAVKAELSKKLPQYMLPHFFIEMEQFPTTPSGKTDRKAFPMPDFANIQTGTKYTAPVTDTEKVIAGIMQRVLNVTKIGTNDNFFDIGGDSLKAIEFVSIAQSEGIYLTPQSIFDNPTIALLVKAISENNREKVEYFAEDYKEIHRLLADSKIGGAAVKRPLGDVLITGATGWLGSHVLDEFLSSESGIAYCLVRGADLTESQDRLRKTLEFYFGDKYVGCVGSGRIVAVCGDITEKITSSHPIGTIIHCAANVKHYGSYQKFYDINVNGTRNMIDLAKEKSARLIHISTASVSGNAFEQADLPPTIFDETKLYIGQCLENVYIRSKFEAEVEVLNARLAGLEAVVVRVGNLSNRYSDLKFQRNHDENATLTKLKAFADLGMCPCELSDFELEFSPVDRSARSVMLLAQHFDKNHFIYHAYDPKTVRFKDIVSAFRSAGIAMKSVHTKEFTKAVSDTANIPDKSFIHKAFINDVGADGKPNFQSAIKLNNNFTTEFLRQIGFEWGRVDGAYLERYIEYFKKLGYWRTKQ